MPAALAQEIRKGSTWTRAVEVEGKDLTGFAAKLQIRASVDSEVVLAEIDTVGGGITIAGSTLTLVIADDVTASWRWTRGVYDLTATDPLGRTETLLAGDVKAVRNVTR
jgi:hypothetical protein